MSTTHLNAPWRPVRCASSWRVYDQDGTAIAKLPASEGPSSERLAYIARLLAKAPELEVLLAECAGMLQASADSLERRGVLRADAHKVLREQHRRCAEALLAIANPARAAQVAPAKCVSYTSEILPRSATQWCGHGLRFGTEAEARRFGILMSLGWLRAPEIRVISTDRPATHTLDDQGLLIERGLA